MIKNVLLIFLILISGMMAIELTNERLKPQIKELQKELDHITAIHTATVEACAESWLKKEITDEELRRINF